jgi:hypothetical protein
MNALVHDVLGKIIEKVENMFDLSFVRQSAQSNAIFLSATGDDMLWKHRHLRDCGRDLSNEWWFWSVLLVSLGIHRAIENLGKYHEI